MRREMSERQDAPDPDGSAPMPWYIYDRRANLLHIAASLQAAEVWTSQYWDIVEVDREEVADHDYLCRLFAVKRRPGNLHNHDFEARIMRRDRVVALGRDPNANPRHPS